MTCATKKILIKSFFLFYDVVTEHPRYENCESDMKGVI